jgi:hypothetical protein
MSDKVWTKNEIRENLLTSDAWLIRGLIAIFQYQTASEQVSDNTTENNGVGFNGVDSFILSKFAKFCLDIKNNGRKPFLTPKQKAIALKKMPKYAGQLAKIANGKI